MSKLKKFAFLNLGLIVLTVGFYFFKIPNGFITGGVTGIATALARLTPVSAAVWIWGLNAGLLLLGFAFLGKGTGVLTVYCSMAYSALAFLLEKILPITEPISSEPLLELVYAVLLTAIGSAIIFNCGGSSGGTDIVALILKKYTELDVGKALLATDFVIAMSSFWLFGISTGLYSLIGLFAKAFLVDGVIDNLNACKYFVVITRKREEISHFIMDNLHHGVTVSAVTGEFTGEEKAMIHTVCKRIEAIRLRTKIKEIDPGAFIIITTSSEIIGRGFRSV